MPLRWPEKCPVRAAMRDFAQLFDHTSKAVENETWELPPEPLVLRILDQIPDRPACDQLVQRYTDCRECPDEQSKRISVVRALRRLAESGITFLQRCVSDDAPKGKAGSAQATQATPGGRTGPPVLPSPVQSCSASAFVAGGHLGEDQRRAQRGKRARASGSTGTGATAPLGPLESPHPPPHLLFALHPRRRPPFRLTRPRARLQALTWACSPTLPTMHSACRPVTRSSAGCGRRLRHFCTRHRALPMIRRQCHWAGRCLCPCRCCVDAEFIALQVNSQGTRGILAPCPLYLGGVHSAAEAAGAVYDACAPLGGLRCTRYQFTIEHTAHCTLRLVLHNR